jgi:excisionase family DNA binding protein
MLKIGRITLISISEAVKQFGVSKETLRRAIRQKQLRAFSAGRRTYLKPEDVQRWKESYYHEFRANAVRVRWERWRKRQKAKGSEESGGNNAATVAQ